MPFDQDRYRRLVASATFNAEFFRGTIQDQSSRGLAMSFVGAPNWSRINGRPCLMEKAPADGATSAAVAALVDYTGTFSVETLYYPSVFNDSAYILRQTGPGTTGGIWLFHYYPGKRMIAYLYTAAGAVARQIISPSGGLPVGRPYHALLQSTTGGTAGSIWVNGVPVVVTLSGAGAVANPVASAVVVGQAALGVSILGLMSIRAYPFALTNDDASCLAMAAADLVGGW